jgi:Domain of unknown function (DUF1648)
MNRKLFTILTALMWIALPLTALCFWQVWDALPASMATHFAADGHPNGWMPRETALYFALGVTAFILVIFTGIAVVVVKQKAKLDAASFVLLGLFYVVVGFVFHVNNGIINHNLSGRPMVASPVLLGLPLAIVLLAWIYIRAQRGPALQEAQTLAEETHGSPLFAGVFLLIGLVEFSVAIAIPQTSVRMATTLLGALMLLIAAHAWSGFRYRFTPSGLEISTLGFRLRSITRDQIGRYGIEKWTVLRGYGIRGVGNTRAYVWGNQVVHITTLEGEVFLGHNDPARLVRDLDMMKQYAHS